MTGHLVSTDTETFLLCTATGMGDDNGFCGSKDLIACASGPAVKGVNLKPLDCWDCGIKSLRANGCCLLCLGTAEVIISSTS